MQYKFNNIKNLLIIYINNVAYSGTTKNSDNNYKWTKKYNGIYNYSKINITICSRRLGPPVLTRKMKQIWSTNTHNLWLRRMADFIPRDRTKECAYVINFIKIKIWGTTLMCVRPPKHNHGRKNCMKPQPWTITQLMKTTLITKRPLINQ